MTFNNEKKTMLMKKDKSKEHKIDDRIKELCEIINSKPDYYTTSSCSGRIVLLKKKKTKQESQWLLKSHDKIQEDELINALREADENTYFKMEPFILHIACKTTNDAGKLIKALNNIGLKRTGAISLSNKIIIEIRGNETLEVPAKNMSKEYITYLVGIANKKMKNNENKIKEVKNLFSEEHYQQEHKHQYKDCIQGDKKNDIPT